MRFCFTFTWAKKYVRVNSFHSSACYSTMAIPAHVIFHPFCLFLSSQSNHIYRLIFGQPTFQHRAPFSSDAGNPKHHWHEFPKSIPRSAVSLGSRPTWTILFLSPVSKDRFSKSRRVIFSRSSCSQGIIFTSFSTISISTYVK